MRLTRGTVSEHDFEYVHYGCGGIAPDGWRNFDASPTLRFERLPLIGRLYTKNERRFPANAQYGDIVKGLPIPLARCGGIYCSHMLEHLALEDFEVAIANTYSYLRPGGTFRLVMPDLEHLARTYLRDGDAVAFISGTLMGTRRRARGLKEFLVEWLGNSKHLWLWDEKAVAARLRAHGFVDIRRAQLGDAEIAAFHVFEPRSRVESGDTSLVMECRRPQ